MVWHLSFLALALTFSLASAAPWTYEKCNGDAAPSSPLDLSACCRWSGDYYYSGAPLVFSGSCRGFTGQLDLQNRKITLITPGAFDNCSATRLLLLNNRLTTIAHTTWPVTLWSPSLASNQLTTIAGIVPAVRTDLRASCPSSRVPVCMHGPQSSFEGGSILAHDSLSGWVAAIAALMTALVCSAGLAHSLCGGCLQMRVNRILWSPVFAVLDADGDGRITRKEYEAGFNLLDTDGDGVITREEFNCASGAPFAMVDKDSDGKVSRAEWNAGFDSFDTNKNGYITAKEFSAVAHPGFVSDALDRDVDGKITREEYNAGFDITDLNKNGTLSREEFNCAIFSIFDKDGDGLMSREKYEAGFDRLDFDGDSLWGVPADEGEQDPGPQEAHRDVCDPHRRQLITRMPVVFLYLVCLLWACPPIQANRNSILNHDNYASAKWRNLSPNTVVSLLIQGDATETVDHENHDLNSVACPRWWQAKMLYSKSGDPYTNATTELQVFKFVNLTALASCQINTTVVHMRNYSFVVEIWSPSGSDGIYHFWDTVTLVYDTYNLVTTTKKGFSVMVCLAGDCWNSSISISKRLLETRIGLKKRPIKGLRLHSGPINCDYFCLVRSSDYFEGNLSLVLQDPASFLSDFKTVDLLHQSTGHEKIQKTEHVIKPLSLPDIVEHVKRNESLVLRSPSQTNNSLAVFFERHLEKKIGCQVSIHLYISPASLGATDTHNDSYGVLVYHSIGHKIWTLCYVENQCEDIELGPGELLYISAGTLHSARTSETSDYSMSFTFGLLCPGFEIQSLISSPEASDLKLRGDCHQCCRFCCDVCRTYWEANSAMCSHHGTARQFHYYNNWGTCNDCNQEGPWICVNCNSGWTGATCASPICQRGEYFQDGGCKKCAAGTFSNIDAAFLQDCIQCTAGLYQDRLGQTSCKQCPAGHYTPSPMACLQCNSGSFAKFPLSTVCDTCWPGYYCPTATVQPIICPQGTYCPGGSSQPIHCPKDHFCPQHPSGLATPLACPLCDASRTGRPSRVGCGPVESGKCIAITIDEGPSCGIKGCTTWYAGQAVSVTLKVAEPLCNVSVAPANSAAIMPHARYCGELVVYLRQNSKLGSTISVVLGTTNKSTVSLNKLWSFEAVVPPNCTAGSSYYLEIDYNAPMQHATSYSRSDTFMIRDYAEFVADRYMRASRGNINQDELDRLCEEASQARGKYLNGRNTLVVYGEMACRCLEYLSSGFDCYGLQASTVPDLSVDAYSKTAEAKFSLIRAFEDRKQFDMLSRAIVASQVLVVDTTEVQNKKVMEQIQLMDSNLVDRELKGQMKNLHDQRTQTSIEIQDATASLMETAKQHTEMSGIMTFALQNLGIKHQNLMDYAMLEMENLQRRLEDAVKDCKSEIKRKALINTVVHAVQIVAGAVMVVFANPSGFALMGDGLVGIASQENEKRLGSQWTEWTMPSAEKNSSAVEEKCESFLDSPDECSSNMLKDVIGQLESQEQSLTEDAKSAVYIDENQMKTSTAVAKFVDGAGKLTRKFVDFDTCGSVADLQVELVEATDKLNLLHGLNLGCLNLHYNRQLLTHHGTSVMRSGTFPAKYVMRLKAATSMVSTDIYLEALMKNNRFSISDGIDMKEMQVQIKSSAEGMIDLEVEYWEIASRLRVLREHEIRLKEQQVSVLADQRRLYSTVMKNPTTLTVTDMSEVFDIEHTMRRGVEREMYYSLRVDQRKMILACQYMCNEVATFETCAEDYTCLQNVHVKILSKYSTCLEKKSRTTSVSTKLAFEVRLPNTLRRAGLLQSSTDLSESQLVKICIDGKAGWDNTHFVRFVSAVLINQTSFDGRLSISVDRSGPSVIQDNNGNRHSYWFQSSRYISQYSPRSCIPQTTQSGTLADVLPSIGGACYTLYLRGPIPNLDANRVRFVFHLETKSGAVDLKMPESWKLIDSDKVPLYFGCSTSPQNECKIDSGKFWCETDLMCVLICTGCSYRPVAVTGHNGNECTSGQITTLEIPSTQGLLSPGTQGLLSPGTQGLLSPGAPVQEKECKLPAWKHLWHHNSTRTGTGILIIEWCMSLPLAGVSLGVLLLLTGCFCWFCYTYGTTTPRAQQQSNDEGITDLSSSFFSDEPHQPNHEHGPAKPVPRLGGDPDARAERVEQQVVPHRDQDEEQSKGASLASEGEEEMPSAHKQALSPSPQSQDPSPVVAPTAGPSPAYL